MGKVLGSCLNALDTDAVKESATTRPVWYVYSMNMTSANSSHATTCANISLFSALIGLGLPAVVFGHIAYAKGGAGDGSLMAVFGFVLGYFEVALAIIILIGIATS